MRPTGGSSGPPPTRPSPRPWPCPGCGGGGGPRHEKRMPDLRTGDGAMTVLELKDVSKAYGQGPARVEALHGVDLTVEAGGMVAVMGPSGSGKFTLLPGRPVAETVALPLELDGTGARAARAASRAALGGLGLADRGNRYPSELSGGERQRVAIARAVVGDRRLLLADEPSGALDSVKAEAVMRLIHEACKRGVAAVVVTHDAQLASWADRVVFLRDGRVVDQTAPLPGPESLLTPGQTP